MPLPRQAVTIVYDWTWNCDHLTWVHRPIDECRTSLMFLTQLDCLSASLLAIWIQVLITSSSALAQCKTLEGFVLTQFHFLTAICNYTCMLAVKMTKAFLVKGTVFLEHPMWSILHRFIILANCFTKFDCTISMDATKDFLYHVL